MHAGQSGEQRESRRSLAHEVRRRGGLQFHTPVQRRTRDCGRHETVEDARGIFPARQAHPAIRVAWKPNKTIRFFVQPAVQARASREAWYHHCYGGAEWKMLRRSDREKTRRVCVNRSKLRYSVGRVKAI
ncbi:hypothetical protein MRX96_005694 [Rhipicephalus microplus]